MGNFPDQLSRWLRRRRTLQALKNRYYSRYDQISNETNPDRYADVFACASKLLSRLPSENLRLLSFGCSTGEECFSLRRYFPRAWIDGVDVNKRNIRVCDARNQDPRIRFDVSTENLVETYPFYDAVFAMSVLCRWPQTKQVDSSANVYPFEKFDKTVRFLNSLVRPNGLLVIYNANFRFTDTHTSERYEALSIPGLDDSGFVYLFSRANRKLQNQRYPYCVFRKLDDP